MNNPASRQRVGKGMLAIAWGVALVLLTLVFGRWEKHQYNPNSNPDSQIINGARQVILEENRQNHYVAGGTINGHPVTFLLDTGATDVVVPVDLAQKLRLEPGAAGMAMTANGPVQVRATRIGELSLGDIRLYNVRASINPGMRGDEILLGMSALKQVEFTQRGGTLVLRQE